MTARISPPQCHSDRRRYLRALWLTIWSIQTGINLQWLLILLLSYTLTYFNMYITIFRILYKEWEHSDHCVVIKYVYYYYSSPTKTIDWVIWCGGCVFVIFVGSLYTVGMHVPYVGDSKRAMDEYTSEIFLGGRVTFNTNNFYSSLLT